MYNGSVIMQKILVELGPKFHKMLSVFVSVVLAKTRQLAHTFTQLLYSLLCMTLTCGYR